MRPILLRFGQRLLGGLAMVIVVATFTFFLVRLMPGNPVQTALDTLIQQGVSPLVAQEKVQALYGFVPHQPLYIQYFHYVWQILHFNLGTSISYTGLPVTKVLLSAIPWTVVMVLSGLLLSFLVGVLMGVIMAVKRSSWLGDSITLSSTFLHGIPQFMLALLLAYLFTTIWRVFPFGAPYNAAYTPGWNFPYILSIIHHAILPVLAYAISGYGGWALSMKSSVVSVLGDDFILAAELRGLKPSIRLGYIAKNAILPLFTVLTLSIGFMFGGSIFIEQIFDYPGLGFMILNSVGSRDYPLMDGAFLLITISVILANLVTDLLYAAIDPRIRR